ncbi:MAG TPA: SRPBCC domain-containing protein, partial [Gaiellaceae bacterium]|nr:SRPBCC domain-containing protein [Gaiellaceae bacterium]
QSLGDLLARFDISRFGVMKHVKVLEEAGLVVTRKVGRRRLHYLNPVPIREIHDRWTGKFAARASAALLGLRDHVEKGVTMSVPAHVYVVYVKASPERIWEALTQSAFTQHYYYASTVDSDWEAGGSYTYSIQGQPAIVGEVLEATAPSRLAMTFDARWDDQVSPDPPSRITWEIEPAGDDLSKLTVVHDGFEAETHTYGQIAGGMPYILSGLKTLLETGEPMAATVGAAA